MSERVYNFAPGPSTMPESALKTLVSRTRSMLNEISRGLGGCIVSETGGYRWESLPGVSVDVLIIIDILERLDKKPGEEERRAEEERHPPGTTGEAERAEPARRGAVSGGIMRRRRRFLPGGNRFQISDRRLRISSWCEMTGDYSDLSNGKTRAFRGGTPYFTPLFRGAQRR